MEVLGDGGGSGFRRLGASHVGLGGRGAEHGRGRRCEDEEVSGELNGTLGLFCWLLVCLVLIREHKNQDPFSMGDDSLRLNWRQ